MQPRSAKTFAATALVCLVLGAVPAFAQVTGSSIVGVVKDETGGVLPGVTIEVTSPALIERFKTTVTDGAGEYRVNDLRPGDYTVTFSLQGFRTSTHADVTIRAAFTASINEVLKPQELE